MRPPRTLAARAALPAALSFSLVSLLYGLAALGQRAAGAPAHASSGGARDGGSGDAAASEPAPRNPSHVLAHCREQHAQPELIRSAYIPRGDSQERRRREALHRAAVRYRTEHYGYFDGFGEASWNAHPPRFFAENTTFMGLHVRLHRRIIPAVQCAEAEIRRTCTEPYHPHALAGIRFQNTYHTGEITNHAYGIALDIDPDRNTCCGCVGRWAQAPACTRPTSSEYGHMAMPECWVHAFERYGFYWLGHDPMRDTMHFEFLGDPDRITR
jgi:hypothetical protein